MGYFHGFGQRWKWSIHDCQSAPYPQIGTVSINVGATTSVSQNRADGASIANGGRCQHVLSEGGNGSEGTCLVRGEGEVDKQAGAACADEGAHNLQIGSFKK